MMEVKLLVSNLLLFIVLQEIQCKNYCWTWGLAESSVYNENNSNKTVEIFDINHPQKQYFGMGCTIYTMKWHSGVGYNCILNHPYAIVDCIASENGTPVSCTKDNTIILEKVSHGSQTHCKVTFLYFRKEYLGKWTIIQTNMGLPFIHEFEMAQKTTDSVPEEE